MQRVDGEPKALKITDLYIDIGCDSRKTAEKRVRIGDPITVNQNFEILHKDIAVARAFDNRIGTWSVAEALRLSPPKRNSTPKSAPSPTPWRKSVYSEHGRLLTL